MFTIVKKSIEWGGRTLEIETGRFARQADGAVYIKYGETSLLCTAVAQKQARDDIDFFPLTVNYQEKTFAAGKIPGGFFKREGRPSEKETLLSRLIDRPIRPLFQDGFYNETQVICTVLSHDLETDSDIPAIVGASAALAISGIPFNGPIGGAKVGMIEGKYVLNPTIEETKESDLELTVAATESSVMMVESEAHELSEKDMLGAVNFGHKEMQPVIKLINELAKECGKERWEVEEKDHSDIKKKVASLGEKDMQKAYKIQEKQERSEKLAEIREKIVTTLEEEAGEDFDANAVNGCIKKLEKEIVRGNIISGGKRIDGRGNADVRDIVSEVGFLPRTHGSALFTRGETQALVVTTLGTGQDEQRIDALEGETTEHFMLHYNFPPYSVGEASFLKSPGRREIGHGKLAWRALRPLMPSKEDFPYTIRIVSEITESNGSSSMATVCGSSLALMDAGVPLKAAVSGIAMGLIKEGDDFAVLSDIMGDEDHLGDMDFKVAGTAEGITSLQMDIKIDGITSDIMQQALEQAHEGRAHILEKMAEALTEARGDVSENAPKITFVTVAKDKIREIIGPGGAVIRDICEQSGAKIDIQDDGTVTIAAANDAQAKKAQAMISDITAELEIGKIYDGKVVKIVDFGAFVNVLPKQDGLVHISELADYRVSEVQDVVQEGDEVKVKVLEIERGKVRLSMKVVDQDSGEDISDQFPESRPRKRRFN